MSTIHEVKCDFCNKKAALKYNGESWLIPQGWGRIWDDEKAELIDEHICASCKPKKKKQKPVRGDD